MGLLVTYDHNLNDTAYMGIVAVDPFMTAVYPAAMWQSSNQLELVSWT